MNLLERYKKEYRPYKLIKEKDFFCYMKTCLPQYATNGTLGYHWPWHGKIIVCSFTKDGQPFIWSEKGMLGMSLKHVFILSDRALLRKPANWDEYVSANNFVIRT